MKYVIEHMENKLYKWCLLEYRNISRIVNKNNLIFANIKSKKLKKYGKVIGKSAYELNLKRACILDIDAKKNLKYKDKKKFDYLIFGGILGDNPRRYRTRRLVKKLRFKTRNLGKKQMSTDNAVLTSYLIMKGKKLKDVKFIDNLEIKINKHLSVVLPYRYVLEDDKPFISKEVLRLAKKEKLI